MPQLKMGPHGSQLEKVGPTYWGLPNHAGCQTPISPFGGGVYLVATRPSQWAGLQIPPKMGGTPSPAVGGRAFVATCLNQRVGTREVGPWTPPCQAMVEALGDPGWGGALAAAMLGLWMGPCALPVGGNLSELGAGEKDCLGKGQGTHSCWAKLGARP